MKINSPRKHSPAWEKATSIDRERYKEIVDEKLENIVIPHDAMLCNDVFCTEHLDQINAFHNDITEVLVSASSECRRVLVQDLEMQC